MVVAEILADFLENDATEGFKDATAGNGFRKIAFNHRLACVCFQLEQ